MNYDLLKQGVDLILKGLGVDQENENFKDTPNRVAKAYLELCSGLEEPTFTLKSFPTDYKGMVIVKPIKTVGMCPHHLLPVEFEIYVGYIPNKKAVGLSKIPRVVEWLAHAPVLQEDLTKNIVDYLDNALKPQGVIVVVKGKHSCMRLRGIRQTHGEMITSHFNGNFKQIDTRNEFMGLIK